ncbi:putative peroxisomal carrier protein [Tothia fuscella]|uniref:Peroxisomal carrier protein n=1 Tax=Tothia fuscella TaxID=1048955 RepID=A0A9P4TSR0_9PEZI|nr:putative peroxisomal carrier protein [Tothia fuscella]
MADRARHEPLPPWIHAVSGAASVVIAQAMLYPLDRIGTKLQVQSKRDAKTISDDAYYHNALDAFVKIVKSEGVQGLYVGLPGSLIGGAAQGYAFNYWHSLLRQMYLDRAGSLPIPSTAVELGIAYGASALSMLFTLPVTNVTTRQRTADKAERKGLIGTANDVLKAGNGITGLWKGISASLLLCLNPTITYGAVERLRIILFQGRNNLRLWESFLLGVLSKAIATVFSHPIVVAKVALVSKPPASRNGKPFESFGEVLTYIVKQEGFFRLWKGLGPGMIKALLFQGLLMILKERSRVRLGAVFYYLRSRRATSISRALAALRSTNPTGLTILK